MISCLLRGGLGNQLFMIFATIATAITYKIPFLFPSNLPHGNQTTKRPTYVDSLFKQIAPFFSITCEELMDATRPSAFSILQLTQHDYKNIVISDLYQNVCLYGYFQSYRYFHQYTENIIKMLKINDFKDRVEHTMTQHFPNFPHEFSISMHFRLGDYVRLQEYHNVLPASYYVNAIQKILTTNPVSNVENRMIYVFCEESDWDTVKITMDTIESTFPISYRRVQIFEKDYEEMLCMSLCSYNIIANSTFSWWGAYLNKRSSMENTVFYPSQWFGPILARTSNTDDMFLPNWTKVSVNA